MICTSCLGSGWCDEPEDVSGLMSEAACNASCTGEDAEDCKHADVGETEEMDKIKCDYLIASYACE